MMIFQSPQPTVGKPPRPVGLPNRQRGVVLMISLIVLVAMALAGIAMVRQLSGGLGIAGNLAFKQSATSIGDNGLETARTWLKAQLVDPNVLSNDIVSPRYYSSWVETFNPLTYDWNDATTVTPAPATGERIRYVIHRLCKTPNMAHTAGLQECVVVSNSSGTGGTTLEANDSPPPDVTSPFYRVTARVDGPRNTASFVQLVMY